MLDTWFSSQLWPFSTLGWPERDAGARDRSIRTRALVTGYEILYLWVARMVMAGLYLVGDVPVPQRRDPRPRPRRAGAGRCAKSLGNVIDPIEIIDRYGADALRFALARAATGSQQDIPLSEEAIEGARHFANKLWNAARLVFRAYRGGIPELPPPERRTLAERWLLSRHEACLAQVDAALDEYRFADAAQALHRFIWSEYCDWGLELEKGRLDADDHERADAVGRPRLGARADGADASSDHALRHRGDLAALRDRRVDRDRAVAAGASRRSWIGTPSGPSASSRTSRRRCGSSGRATACRRRIRSRSRWRSPPVTGRRSRRSRRRSSGCSPSRAFERSRRLRARSRGRPRCRSSWGSVRFPAGLYDEGEERRRLAKRRDEVASALERSRRKLANEGFRSKAAPDIVAAEEGKAASLEAQLAAIDAELADHGG